MIVQREIEEQGIPTILIAALPPIARHYGTSRAVAPAVPMGANLGEPGNAKKQSIVLKETLKQLIEIEIPGTIVPLPYSYETPQGVG